MGGTDQATDLHYLPILELLKNLKNPTAHGDLQDRWIAVIETLVLAVLLTVVFVGRIWSMSAIKLERNENVNEKNAKTTQQIVSR